VISRWAAGDFSFRIEDGAVRTIYQGKRTGDIATVLKIVDGNPAVLDPRTDVRNHSPTGLEWGYAGSGPAQLALAVLVDALLEPLGAVSKLNPERRAAEAQALQLYHSFKFDRIAELPRGEPWEISADDVRSWVEAQDEVAA